MKSYKDIKTHDERVSESNRILAKHANYIPVIIESDDKRISLNKRKFLSPNYASASYLSMTIQKHLPKELTKSGQISIPMFYKYKTKRKNLFGVETDFENTVMISGTNMMSEIYRDFKLKNNIPEKNRDLFLYITICLMETFGTNS